MLLFTSNAYAGGGFDTGIDGLIIFYLFIWGMLTIIEIIIFIIHKSCPTKARRKLFIITSAIYIPILGILLGVLLTNLLAGLLNIRGPRGDDLMLPSYILIILTLYALLIFLIKRDKL